MSAPTNSLAGKVAVITGASKGIGRATALRLASLGASVVINYASSAKEADDLVRQIGSDRALAVRADAGSIPDLEMLVSKTVEKFGKIDILIPNAAVLQMCDLAGTTEEQFDKAMQLNVKGPYFLCQKAAPHMSAGSHVVLISTSVCHFSSIMPNYLLYATTKGAIEQMTRVMAKDLGRKGIFVNAVAPGPTGTELFFEGKSEQLLNTIKGWTPFNRIGEPDEIAEVIAFVSGSRWVNGQVFKANGGMA
ncbi:putative short-chain dehydrogenase reductase protein [Lasiodiplodia theobromae]|uniref:Oxidoreductase n=2 Tax=Lasiodiplodia TaxID=66739 RepID=A0AA39YL43_9PEZI|nr:putative oxidoreductase [Lasiodiplodia theobromae]KAF9637084.1 putative short-chain dehydrogenase reductase protein [Lasiodiplodia theobromae]KAK0654586.1 putative oxidoreductase [Lasiodiplodia hormozganensis]